MEDKHAHECNKERKYLVSQRPIDTEEVDIRNTSCPHRIVSINDKCSLEEGGEWTLVAVELLVGSETGSGSSVHSGASVVGQPLLLLKLPGLSPSPLFL